MTNRLRQQAPRLLLMFALATAASGCGSIEGLMARFKGQDPQSPPPPSLQFTQAPDSSAPPAPATGPLTPPITEQSPQLQREPQGFLGIPGERWLGIAALSLGVLGTGLGVMNWLRLAQLNARIRKHRTDINSVFTGINAINKSRDNTMAQLTALQSSYQQLERRQANLTSSLDQQLSQAVDAQQRLMDAKAAQIAPSPGAGPPLPPSPAQLLSALTEAINRGDRQAIRNDIRAQLNITSASENEISMGRMTQTQLEEVTGGGSYWLASIGGDDWLYPTTQTLKGYAQLQPSKGIFSYIKQSIPTPHVLSPARLTPNGSGWQIVELGSIAIPG